MSFCWAIRTLLLSVLALLLIGACSNSSPSTTSSSAPIASVVAESKANPTATTTASDPRPTAVDGEIYTIDISSQEDPPSEPDDLAALSDLVISGVVAEFLEPLWTTANGKRPDNVLDRAARPGTILTPIVIELDHAPYMDVSAIYDGEQHIVLFIEGGTRDGITVTHNGEFFQYQTGDRVLIGLTSIDNDVAIAAYGNNLDGLVPDGHATAWLPTARYVLRSGLAKNGPLILHEDEFFTQLEAAIAERKTSP